MKEVMKLALERFNLESGRAAELERWQIAKEGEVVDDTVPLPNYSQARAATELFGNEYLVGSRGQFQPGRDLRVAAFLPFSLGAAGQLGKFGGAFVRDSPITVVSSTLELEEARRPEFAMLLAQYARLRGNVNPSRDELATRLWALLEQGRDWQVGVAPSRWSMARTSMDSGHIVIESKEGDEGELRLLAELLVERYGRVTIRQAIAQEMERNPYPFLTPGARAAMGPEISATGRLPTFSSGACAWNLGTCSVIWCKKDGKFVITRRGRGVGGLNVGRVCAASGGVKWSVINKHMKQGTGFFAALDEALASESVEELYHLGPALKVIRVGFAREVPRMGSPEWFYILEFEGTAEEFVQAVAANEGRDAYEIDSIIYAFPPEVAINLLTSPDGADIIQYKGLINLWFALMHMNLPEFPSIF